MIWLYLRYCIKALITIPLLPIMYFQGRRIRSEVPSLPEAIDPMGKATNGSGRIINVLLMGESTVAGVGVSRHSDGFAGEIAQQLCKRYQVSVDWQVVAKSGYTIKEVLDNLCPALGPNSRDIIIIGIGGNDAFTLNRPWNFVQHARRLILNLRNKYPDAPIVFTNMPPIKEFPAFTSLIKMVIGGLVEIHGKALAHLIGEYENVYYNAEVISLQNWEDKIINNEVNAIYFSDGVHPSQLTYQLWAEDMVRFINEECQIDLSTLRN